MKWLFLRAVMVFICFLGFPVHAQTQGGYQDIDFLAECAAIFSVKAVEKQGKVHPETLDSYYAAAADFYEKATNKGGPEMKKTYEAKMDELNNLSPNDAVGNQSKKALEKQCRAAAPDLGIKLK